MAFSLTQRASNNNDTSSSATLVSSAFTPTANSRLFVFAFAERAAHVVARDWNITNTGGLSFTLQDQSTLYDWNGDANYAANCIGWYADIGGSPTSMTVTVQPDLAGGSLHYISLIVFDVTGYDTGTPFAQASVDNGAELGGGDSESGTLTLGGAPTSGNLVVAMFASSADTGGAFATPSGYTVLTSQNNSGYCHAGVFYHTSTTTAAVACTDLGDTVGNWGGIIFEMTLESGGDLSVSVDTATIDAVVGDISVVPSAASTTLDSLLLQSVLQDLNVSAGVATLSLDTLSLDIAPDNLSVVAGAATLGVDSLLLQSLLGNVSVLAGAASVGTTTLVLDIQAGGITVATGVATIDLDTLSMNIAVDDASIVAGAISQSLESLLLQSAIGNVTISVPANIRLPDKIRLAKTNQIPIHQLQL